MSHLLKNDSDNNEAENFKIEAHFRDKLLLRLFILTTCVKFLLVPTYHSTDFEVHRNWLAITHSLPINEWYSNEKSQWTLDYPPLFAWFEFALSKVAFYIDPEMLKVDNLNYVSKEAKLFHRSSVMFMDLIFLFGIREVGNVFCKTNQSFIIFTLLSLGNVGLLLVDHIHFQYNGFLLGILLISIAKVSKTTKEGEMLQGALWFAILLNLKHLYLYVAPAFGIWLLRSYCLKEKKFFSRFFKLGMIVFFVLLLSLGPFIKQLPLVFSRLFPFKRGLVHAYWAANAWALYAGVDKVLSVIFKKVGWLKGVKIASMTGGLVQEDAFLILPTPTPFLTFLITFLLILPSLWILFFKTKNYSNSKKFVKCLVLCGLTSFMFGWHVHEKAILTAIIPLCILASTNVYDARIFIILSAAGHTALFPLLYPTEFAPLKLILWFTYLITAIILLKDTYGSTTLRFFEVLYLAFLPAVIIYDTLLHNVIFKSKLPFLPLALTSVYCALGISYCYIIYYYDYIFEKTYSVPELQKNATKRVCSVCHLKKIS